MNIVLLDDSDRHNQLLRAALTTLIDESRIEADIVLEATRAEQVLEYAAANPPQTLYFLDIRLEQEPSGLELCQRIQARRSGDRFIFVSAYPHYALDCLKLHAYDLLVKPLDPQELRACVLSLYREMTNEPGDALELPIGSRTIRVPINSIYYLQAQGRNVRVHTSRGDYTCAASLSGFEPTLLPRHFVRTHRKYLVNGLYIQEWDTSSDELVIYGEHLPISRRRQQQLVRAKGEQS